MKNLGALISTHKGKKFYLVIYIIPIVILLLMCYPITKGIINTPADNRMMLYVLLGMNLLLVIILLISMKRSQPPYHFELFENGVRLVYQNSKKEALEILFSDISNYWQFRIPLNEKVPNLLVFAYGQGQYGCMNTKFNGAREFVKKFAERYTAIQSSIKTASLENGERIEFLLLPSTTPQTILVEGAFLPFIKNVTFSKISLDKYTLFASDKAESISTISSARINPETNTLTIFSTSGAIIFEYGYDLVSNPDLLLLLTNSLAESR